MTVKEYGPLVDTAIFKKKSQSVIVKLKFKKKSTGKIFRGATRDENMK